MKINNKIFGTGSLLSAAFIYSFFAILSRTIGFKLPLFYQSWSRTILVLAILWILILFFKKWVKVEKKDILWILLRSLGGFLSFFGIYIAFIFLPIGTTYFIFYAGSTVGGYLIGRVLFGEKVTKIKILSLFLSLFGLWLIYSLDFNAEKIWYIVAALVSGLGVAVWNTFSKKISHLYPALQLNFLDNLIFFLMAFFISLFIREQWVLPTLSSAWVANLFFAVMFLVTGQLMIYGFSRLEAHAGSLIMLTEILFGLIIGFIFYREVLSLLAITGGTLIILSMILPEIKMRKQ